MTLTLSQRVNTAKTFLDGLQQQYQKLINKEESEPEDETLSDDWSYAI